MDCARFSEIVHDLDRDGTEGFELRFDALDHAEECVQCNSLLSEAEIVDFSLNCIAMEDAAEKALPRVEAALLAEFRRNTLASVAKVRANKSLPAMVLGIAAALILTVGIGLRYWMIQRASPSSIGPVAVAGQGIRTAGTAAGISNDSLEEVAGGDEDSENATDFVPLPYADDPATLENGTIVRVTLSQAALASFGVPVADWGAPGQIPAEIALSEDGVPQAIRLVAQDDSDRTY